MKRQFGKNKLPILADFENKLVAFHNEARDFITMRLPAALRVWHFCRRVWLMQTFAQTFPLIQRWSYSKGLTLKYGIDTLFFTVAHIGVFRNFCHLMTDLDYEDCRFSRKYIWMKLLEFTLTLWTEKDLKYTQISICVRLFYLSYLVVWLYTRKWST